MGLLNVTIVGIFNIMINIVVLFIDWCYVFSLVHFESVKVYMAAWTKQLWGPARTQVARDLLARSLAARTHRLRWCCILMPRC